jgi:hypothetical protein
VQPYQKTTQGWAWYLSGQSVGSLMLPYKILSGISDS